MGNGVYINGKYEDKLGGEIMNEGPDLGAKNVKNNYLLKNFCFLLI